MQTAKRNISKSSFNPRDNPIEKRLESDRKEIRNSFHAKTRNQ